MLHLLRGFCRSNRVPERYARRRLRCLLSSKALLLAPALLSALLVHTGSQAAQPVPAVDTLTRVREQGILRLGVRKASRPFSFQDEPGQYRGYSVDLCKAIVERIAGLPGMPAVRTEFVEVTSASRIPRLVIGDYDLECGSTSNTPARAEHVAFSHTIFVVSIVAAVSHPSLQNLHQLRNAPALAELGIALTSGTTAVGAVRQFEADTNLTLNRRFTSDHDESFRLLVEGKVAAFVHDDVLLAALIAEHRRTEALRNPAAATRARVRVPDAPTTLRMLDLQLPQDHYALMLRKDDEPLRQLVDATLTDLMTGGEIMSLYERWFMRPIDKGGLMLNLKLSSANQAVFQKPMTAGAASRSGTSKP